jgi:predicted GNAT superfamily acetyltransferase
LVTVAEMNFAIRPYTPADLDALHAINQAEVPAVGSVTPPQLAHIAAQSAIALVAATDSGELAGFALVLPPEADYGSDNFAWFKQRYADFLYLDRVAISPAHQRRGIGRALYEAVEAAAPAARPSATDWTLEVNLRPRNERSLAFHAAMGFVEVGRHESQAGYLVSMMARPLAAAGGTPGGA